MLTIYGIKNCDTMKKAFAWLDERHIPYQFHDYKKQGLDEVTLQHWLTELGWQGIVNQKGTTWRKLALNKDSLTNDTAMPIIKDNLSLIKRPLVQCSDGLILTGFAPTTWSQAFEASPPQAVAQT